MGLLDSLVGAAISKVAGGDGLTGVLGSLLSNDGGHGGLSGLTEKFGQAGLGDVIGSWIGKGENLPISADQLQSVLGSDAVSSIASKFGLAEGDAMSKLAGLLPGVVDKLTPNGEAPSSGLGSAGDLLGMLGGLLNNKG